MIKKWTIFEHFFDQKVNHFWTLFWIQKWTVFGPFFDSIFGLFSKPRFLNYEGGVWWGKRKCKVLKPDSTRNVVGTDFLIIRKKKFLLFVHVINFEKFFFRIHFFKLCSYIWLFSGNVDFEKNSLKNQLFANFVLVSGFFQKIEKIADTSSKFTQNRGKNHESIG